jgi:CRP-like cAMP-binding protein
MADERSQYIALLRRQYLFQGLDPDQMERVVDKFEVVQFQRGYRLFSAGDPPDYFYVLFQGRARVTRPGRGGDKFLNYLTPGDYFGERGLLTQRPRSITVTIIEPSTLLRLNYERFFELLDEYPKIRMNLSLTAESRRLAHRKAFDWLREDEVIYLIARKHRFFLGLSLIVPVLLAIASFLALLSAILSLDPSGARLFYIVGFVLMAVALGWGAWNWIDWGNDYYIVTNQRVVWLEKLVALYDSRREAPLANILAVETSSSQLGRIVHYGNVLVRTFTGVILMRRMDHPERFVQFVEGFRERTRQESKVEENLVFEYQLRQRLKMPLPPMPVSLRPKPPAPPSKSEPKPGSLRFALINLFKVRYEVGNTVTYRKHWLVLLKKTWLPGIVLGVEIALVIFLFYERLAKGVVLISGFFPFFIFGLIYLVTLLWWGYHYLDWSNDIYRVTPEQILDIEKKPLGREEKKVASLDSILSLEHLRAGIIQIIFNYGTVTINIGQEKFLFYTVYNPDQVQQEIADRMEARNQKIRKAEAERERERILDQMIAYYHTADTPQQIQNRADWDLNPE